MIRQDGYQMNFTDPIRSLAMMARGTRSRIDNAKRLVLEVKKGDKTFLENKDQILEAQTKICGAIEKLTSIDKWIEWAIQQNFRVKANPETMFQHKIVLEGEYKKNEFPTLLNELGQVFEAIDKLVDSESLPYENWEMSRPIPLREDYVSDEEAQSDFNRMLSRLNVNQMEENFMFNSQQVGKFQRAETGEVYETEPTTMIQMSAEHYNHLIMTVRRLEAKVENMNKPMQSNHKSNSGNKIHQQMSVYRNRSDTEHSSSSTAYDTSPSTTSRKSRHYRTDNLSSIGSSSSVSTKSKKERAHKHVIVKTKDQKHHDSKKSESKFRYVSRDRYDQSQSSTKYGQSTDYECDSSDEEYYRPSHHRENSKYLKKTKKVLPKGKLSEFPAQSKSRAKTQKSSLQDSNSGYETAQTDWSEIMKNSNKNSWSKIKLQPFELEPFSGKDSYEYKEWRTMFMSVYGDNPRVDSVSKLIQLKHLVTDDARTLIQPLQLSARNFKTAMTILDENYLNDSKPLEVLYDRFIQFEINQTDYKQIMLDVNKLATIVYMMQNEKGSVNEPYIYMGLIRKLPEDLKRKLMERMMKEKHNGNFADIHRWLKEIIRTEISIEVSMRRFTPLTSVQNSDLVMIEVNAANADGPVNEHQLFRQEGSHPEQYGNESSEEEYPSEDEYNDTDKDGYDDQLGPSDDYDDQQSE